MCSLIMHICVREHILIVTTVYTEQFHALRLHLSEEYRYLEIFESSQLFKNYKTKQAMIYYKSIQKTVVDPRTSLLQ